MAKKKKKQIRFDLPFFPHESVLSLDGFPLVPYRLSFILPLTLRRKKSMER